MINHKKMNTTDEAVINPVEVINDEPKTPNDEVILENNQTQNEIPETVVENLPEPEQNNLEAVNLENNPTVETVQNTQQNTQKPKTFKTLSIFLCLALIVAMGVVGFVSLQSSSKDNRLKVLEDKLNAQQKEISNANILQDQNTVLDNQIKQLKNTVADKNQAINEAGTKVLQYEADLKAKDEKIKDLTDQNTALTAQNKQLTTENASSKNTLNSIKNQVGTIFGIR
jgi:cell division protein FtsB